MYNKHSPAAIVSPPLRIKIRPISLFVEKGSSGMAVHRLTGPEKAACRIEICTSAEVPFVKTLLSVNMSPTQVGKFQQARQTEDFVWQQRRTCARGWRSALILPLGHHENDGKVQPTYVRHNRRGRKGKANSPMFRPESALGYQRQ